MLERHWPKIALLGMLVLGGYLYRTNPGFRAYSDWLGGYASRP